MAPGFSDFVHGPTLLLAALMGITVVWSMTYFYLYASRVARSEVFLAVVALLPFMTFLVEYLAGAFRAGGYFDGRSGDFAAGWFDCGWRGIDYLCPQAAGVSGLSCRLVGWSFRRFVVSLSGAFRCAQRHPTWVGQTLGGFLKASGEFRALIAPDEDG